MSDETQTVTPPEAPTEAPVAAATAAADAVPESGNVEDVAAANGEEKGPNNDKEQKKDEGEGTSDEGTEQQEKEAPAGDKGRRERRPIPTEPPEPVPRPDDAAYQKRVDELTKRTQANETEREQITEAIDKTMESSKEMLNRVKDARARLSQIVQEKRDLGQQRQTLLDQLKGRTPEGDRASARAREIRSQVKVTNLDALEDRIRSLEMEQETGRLSLQQEKRLVKEISDLRASRELVKELYTIEGRVRDARQRSKDERESIGKQLDKLKEEIQSVGDRIGAQKEVVNQLSTQLNGAREDVPKLLERRKTLKQQFGKDKDELRKIKQEHYQATKKYKDYLYILRRIQAEKRRAEYEALKAAEQAERKRIEDESKPKHPKAREIVLCNVMENYLRSLVNLPALEFPDPDTLVTGQSSSATAAPRLAANVSLTSGSRTGDASATKVDASSLGVGRTLGKKSTDDADDFGALLGTGKKKGGKNKRGGRGTAGGAPDARPVKHTLEVLSSLQILNVSPPKDTSQVSSAIDQIQAKRQAFEAETPSSPSASTSPATAGGAAAGDATVAA